MEDIIIATLSRLPECEHYVRNQDGQVCFLSFEDSDVKLSDPIEEFFHLRKFVFKPGIITGTGRGFYQFENDLFLTFSQYGYQTSTHRIKSVYHQIEDFCIYMYSGDGIMAIQNGKLVRLLDGNVYLLDDKYRYLKIIGCHNSGIMVSFLHDGNIKYQIWDCKRIKSREERPGLSFPFAIKRITENFKSSIIECSDGIRIIKRLDSLAFTGHYSLVAKNITPLYDDVSISVDENGEVRLNAGFISFVLPSNLDPEIQFRGREYNYRKHFVTKTHTVRFDSEGTFCIAVDLCIKGLDEIPSRRVKHST